MKIAQLLHNPGAGDEEHSKNDLMSLIKSEGFDCRYASTKKHEWKDLKSDVDFLVVAGGDGTVRKVARHLLTRKLLEKQFPVALLPNGTANNIAGTLKMASAEPRAIVQSWHTGRLKTFDVGLVEGLPKKQFFLEGAGYGVFPQLMKAMKDQQEKSSDSPEEKLGVALGVLADVIQSYKTGHCRIKVDGVDYSGDYLLVEVMNSCSIGPNLVLAPAADPGDGLFEVVLVSESQRDGLATYVQNRIKGVEGDCWGTVLRGKRIEMRWDGTEMHVDDQLIKSKKPREIRVTLNEGALSFLGVQN